MHFLSKYKNYILISLIIYLAGLITGINTPLYMNIIIKTSTHQCKGINYSISTFLLLILKNNLYLIFLILCGSITMGVLSIINLYLNGFQFGYNVKIFYNNYNINISKLIILIVPHGIFEIPAIIIAGAAGFKIPYEIVRYLMGKREQVLKKEDIKKYLTLALISIHEKRE